jgi:DNA repair protein RadD
MTSEEREQIEVVLGKIPASEWQDCIDSEEAIPLRRMLDGARQALQQAGAIKPGKPGKPVSELMHLLGARLLGDPSIGPKIRLMLLRSTSASRWKRLKDSYNELAGRRSQPLHGKATQEGKGSAVMADYWHRGSRWSLAFCEELCLPAVLAEEQDRTLPDDEVLEPVLPLPSLHDFQDEVYEKLRELLSEGKGSTAVLSLPTGAGKTRVAIEAILDHLALSTRGQRNCVLWIAQSEELLRQAWECFRQNWSTPPERANGNMIERWGTLSIRRAWGGRNPEEVTLNSERSVILAGIQQLAAWHSQNVALAEIFPSKRFACVVIDEAHRTITSQHREVLIALGLRQQYRWEPLASAPPLVGLTSTPWRSNDEETESMQRFFQNLLLTPATLKNKPIATLQKRKILSQVQTERLVFTDVPQMTPKQLERMKTFHEIPEDFVVALGFIPERNAIILKRLLALSQKSSVLVFACSIEHARLLTVALEQSGRRAACVTGQTPREERFTLIHSFRKGDINFLCNVGVLTTGFDAPKVDTVCITRPTTSSLLYEQMVGRGLRGPKNGGTEKCLVIDVQDEGLPVQVMSYERVKQAWDVS